MPYLHYTQYNSNYNLLKFQYKNRFMLPTVDEVKEATLLIYNHIPPTPQYSWLLLNQALGCEVWLKHENHTPVGAFKIRGGLIYCSELAKDKKN